MGSCVENVEFYVENVENVENYIKNVEFYVKYKGKCGKLCGIYVENHRNEAKIDVFLVSCH